MLDLEELSDSDLNAFIGLLEVVIDEEHLLFLWVFTTEFHLQTNFLQIVSTIAFIDHLAIHHFLIIASFITKVNRTVKSWERIKSDFLSLQARFFLVR